MLKLKKKGWVLLMEEIKELLENKNISKLRSLLDEMLEQDIAAAFEELTKE